MKMLRDQQSELDPYLAQDPEFALEPVDDPEMLMGSDEDVNPMWSPSGEPYGSTFGVVEDDQMPDLAYQDEGGFGDAMGAPMEGEEMSPDDERDLLIARMESQQATSQDFQQRVESTNEERRLDARRTRHGGTY